MTESDSGQKGTAKVPEQEQESWPTFKGFGLANYDKIRKDRGYKSSFMEYLESRGQKTRSLFDKMVEKMIGRRIDGAGNWLITMTLCVGSCTALIMYMRHNDRLRLQMDDVLSYRDQLQMEIANMQQQLDELSTSS